MIISNDNIKIEDNITTYKCPVKSEQTVLLMPSQVKKYLGSYLKYKAIGIGILLNKNYILDIVSEETIDNRKWLLVVYNDKYYYTPSEYIDTENIIQIKDIDTNKSEEPQIMRNVVSKAAAVPQKVEPGKGEKYTRTILHKDSYQVATLTAGTDVPLYNYPDHKSSVSARIGTNHNFVIQSKWKDNQSSRYYYGTQTFTDSAAYISTNENIKVLGTYSNNKPVYWSMIYIATDCYLPSGKKYLSLAKCDLTWPYGQDWKNGKHLNAYQTGNGINCYSYPAKCASPLADSADMFNNKYFGTLKILKPVSGLEMHRVQNASNIIEKAYCLNDISVKSLNNNSKFTNYLKSSMKNPTAGSLLAVVPNINLLYPADNIIVTNYVQSSSINYYIGFKKTSSVNGAIAFFAIPDYGKDYLSYSTGIPDYSTQMAPIENKTTGQDKIVTDTKVDTSKTTADGRNFDDPSDYGKQYEDDELKAYGIHLGVGDTSEFHVPGVMENAPTVPPSYDGWPIFADVAKYNLSDEAPFDTKHLTHMNRFHLPTNNGGLSTKSFIFVTRPDLNLYHELDRSGSVDSMAMNPSLKRLPGFKYIARLRGTPEAPGIGNIIMNSLEYYGTHTPDTPWLSVMTNQAKGYTPIDREMDVTEMGETFHGNKVIYAEPTFKHKIAGTVTIPFSERRDLGLYFTLRMWIEYIQAVSLGYCEPRWIHRYNGEIDYAVSLYYIQTDETMENIIYWEKLTGLIPLTIPDSFFEWTEGTPQKNMDYSITFAYSFRSVLDEYHLSEINNLYTKWRTSNITAMPMNYPNSTYAFNKDPSYDSLITRIATFYGKVDDNNEEFVKKLNDQNWLEQFYYSDYSVSADNASIKVKFLPNWNKELNMYGIPYVKGPFIEHDPKSQKYKLRWV